HRGQNNLLLPYKLKPGRKGLQRYRLALSLGMFVSNACEQRDEGELSDGIYRIDKRRALKESNHQSANCRTCHGENFGATHNPCHCRAEDVQWNNARKKCRARGHDESPRRAVGEETRV